MNLEHIKEIASAVLYEGYLLYPYRHSALKNRQRWNFGVVYPREYSEANGSLEPWCMRTECLLTGQPDATLDISVGFLHLLTRRVAQPVPAGEQHGTERHLLAGQLAYEPWEEGREREVSAPGFSLRSLLAQPHRIEIAFSQAYMEEYAAEASGEVIVREQRALAGAVVISAERVAGDYSTDLYRLRVHIENTTPFTNEPEERRDAILLQSFVSTHTILRIAQGSFISLLEPPDEFQDAAKACQNERTWPVLVGEQGAQDALLSSPIILYDYPQIAPESPGALFDGTEIDEILTLRILTLSDEEKAELRQGDERVRALLERTEALTPEQFLQLHGTMRDLRPLLNEQASHEPVSNNDIPTFSTHDEEALPARSPVRPQEYPGEDYPPPSTVRVAGREARVGDTVRLHPSARADAFDLLLDGKTARIEAIHQDFENRLYLVVTVDDDPGREQWDERVLPGHRFFFFPEEVELLSSTPA